MTTDLSLPSLRAGGKGAIARALTAVEEQAETPEIIALLDTAWLQPTAHVIGLTGPPGVGKSTLIDAMIRRYRAIGDTVAVVAVDPSSRSTGGALLGDRTRFQNNPDDQGIFVRSLAARGQLGGLTALAFPAIVLLAALYDRVLVETVGVGQSEADVSGVADTIVLCVQPGSGDSLQFMKAGIMEIPDIAVVTKADMGQPARQALSDLKGALSLSISGGAAIPQLAVASMKGEGMDDLLAACDAHREKKSPREHTSHRHTQATDWLRSTITSSFGSRGCAALGDALKLPDNVGPFGQSKTLHKLLKVTRSAAP